MDPRSFATAQRKKLTTAQRAYLTRMDGLLAWIRGELARRKIVTHATDAEIFAFIQDNHDRNGYANFPVKFEMFISGDGQNRARFRIPPLACKHVQGLADGNAYLVEVDRALDYQKVPVGLNLCANVLTHKNYRGYASYGTLKNDCQTHAVVLIGKRFGRNGCEYLLRNSWGAGYSDYAWPVDSGDVWVSEAALTANLYGTSTIRY